MKKSILILSVLFFAFISCKKEELCTSNCGKITNDGIDGSCYWLEIQNECTNNKKTFCFDQSTWMSNYVGNNFCVTNEQGW